MLGGVGRVPCNGHPYPISSDLRDLLLWLLDSNGLTIVFTAENVQVTRNSNTDAVCKQSQRNDCCSWASTSEEENQSWGS